MSSSPGIQGGTPDKRKQVTVHSHTSPLGSPFNPTRLHFSDLSRSSSSPVGEWSSRRARKGRYRPKEAGVHWLPALEGKEDGKALESRVVHARVKEAESHLKPGWRGDVSFWLAFTFTLGSAVWVVNGFLVWLPILRPELAGTTYTNTAAALAFVGGTIFVVGSYLMVVEALDRGRETSFGTAIEEVLQHRRASPAAHDHERHREVSEKVAQLSHPLSRDGSQKGGGDGMSWQDGAKGWVWWGKPLWRDLGYDAALVQLCAATIFWIATVTGLPGVISGLYSESASVPIEDVFYWSPQVVGGSGFILSSLILMIEVQKKWWLPKLDDIGWHIGFWNLVGAIGFTLCGALGYSSSSGAVYQSALSTFWGSWAFLIGSGIQICESVWREAPSDEKAPAAVPPGNKTDSS